MAESKVKNKSLSAQSREIVANVLKFMKEEFENGEYIIPLHKVKDRVAAATGISIRTLTRIVKESKKIETGESMSFKEPYVDRIQKKPKTDLDDIDVGVLRRSIQNFYIIEEKVPTVKGILAKFSADTGYDGKEESLRKILHGIGYRWRKTKTNRKLLMEKNDIANLRCTFLRTLWQYREARRPIIFMDETYVHTSHTNEKSWDDDSNTGVRKPISKGEQIIIVHAGNEDGFIPGAYARWRSSSATGDYHHEMNFENYKKWLINQLIPNLPKNSVLVIDNAPYHNKQIRRCPISTTPKVEMIQWLQRRNINFCNNMTTPELYNIIQQHKPKYKEYEIDQLLNYYNHDVLRLPPYHSDLNPIQLVLASMKQYVASKNVTFQINDVETLCDEFFATFSKEEWQRRCEHTRKIEDDYIAQQPHFDEVIDNLITNLQEDFESEESDDESDMEI